MIDHSFSVGEARRPCCRANKLSASCALAPAAPPPRSGGVARENQTPPSPPPPSATQRPLRFPHDCDAWVPEINESAVRGVKVRLEGKERWYPHSFMSLKIRSRGRERRTDVRGDCCHVRSGIGGVIALGRALQCRARGSMGVRGGFAEWTF